MKTLANILLMVAGTAVSPEYAWSGRNEERKKVPATVWPNYFDESARVPPVMQSPHPM